MSRNYHVGSQTLHFANLAKQASGPLSDRKDFTERCFWVAFWEVRDPVFLDRSQSHNFMEVQWNALLSLYFLLIHSILDTWGSIKCFTMQLTCKTDTIQSLKVWLWSLNIHVCTQSLLNVVYSLCSSLALHYRFSCEIINISSWRNTECLICQSSLCLHVFFQALLKDPLYIGLRHKRIRSQAYDDLLDEFMKAVSDRYDHIGLQFINCPLPLGSLLL